MSTGTTELTVLLRQVVSSHFADEVVAFDLEAESILGDAWKQIELSDKASLAAEFKMTVDPGQVLDFVKLIVGTTSMVLAFRKEQPRRAVEVNQQALDYLALSWERSLVTHGVQADVARSISRSFCEQLLLIIGGSK